MNKNKSTVSILQKTLFLQCYFSDQQLSLTSCYLPHCSEESSFTYTCWGESVDLYTSVGLVRPLPVKSTYSQSWNVSLRTPPETFCVQIFSTDLECISNVTNMANNDAYSELNLTFVLKFMNIYIYIC